MMRQLLCLGDSITDCGRLFSPDGLGYGYVKELDRRLNSSGDNYQIINRGIDGFTVKRVLDDVGQEIDRHPAFVTILIGINDIGLMMNTDRTHSQQKEMLSQSIQSYRLLLDKVRELSPGKIILMEPFIFPHPQEYANWIPWVRQMSGQIEDLAQEYNCPYLLLHDRFNDAAREQGYNAVTPDGIHLTDGGHQMLADLLLNYISANGIGNIETT